MKPKPFSAVLFIGVVLACSAMAATAQPAAAPVSAPDSKQNSVTERSINASVVVKASPSEVYRVFTTADGIKSFFAPDAVVEARVDGLFEVHMNPFAEPGMKGADGMRFLALDPNKMVSFTWNAPPSLPEARKQRTVVIIRFIERGANETEVRLHHVGWGDGGEWDKAYSYLSRAWPNVLANLQKRFTGGPIDWKPWLEQMQRSSKEQ